MPLAARPFEFRGRTVRGMSESHFTLSRTPTIRKQDVDSVIPLLEFRSLKLHSRNSARVRGLI
jgi:hypothetical protein